MAFILSCVLWTAQPAAQMRGHVLGVELSPSQVTTSRSSVVATREDLSLTGGGDAATDCDSVALLSRSSRGKSNPNILSLDEHVTPHCHTPHQPRAAKAHRLAGRASRWSRANRRGSRRDASIDLARMAMQAGAGRVSQPQVVPAFAEPTTPDEVFAQLNAIDQELTRRRWAADPEAWASERLGVKLWSGQAKILRSVAENRRTAAQTCHEIGKSFDGGILTGWWIDTHKPGEAFVITTAPTNPQVKVILWKEIGRVHQKGNLDGRTTQTEWKMLVGRKEEIVAMGRKPNDYSPTAMQGVHAPYVLALVDEANGVRGAIWESLDSLIANDESKICEFGNPDDPTGEFYEHCKPGSGYNVVQIGAFDTPNFTGEEMPAIVLKQLIGHTYVEEKRKKWAPRWVWNAERTRCSPPPDAKPEDTNPMWQSKILGLFPSKADGGGLIPMAWIKAAQIRELQPGTPVELGVDVGGGGDESSVCVRRGQVYRIRRTDNDPDTMSQCGKVIADMQDVEATAVKLDKIGIGWGITNRGKELGHPFFGINVGESPTTNENDDTEADDERFVNLKAQLYWGLRCAFERGEVDLDPEDDDLAAELVSIRYGRRSDGKIIILNKKKDAQGRTIASPNRAESMVLAHAPVPVEEMAGGGYVW